MKKVLTMVAVAAVAITATADLTSFQYKGGKLFADGGAPIPAGTISQGAVTVLADLTPFVVDNNGQLEINIINIADAYGITDIAVGPVFAGGVYSTSALTEQPSAVIGQNAYLVFDINGGGIQVGDVIGLGGGAVLADLKPDDNPAAATQEILAGDITSNVTVIPEPATFGLMGIAGLGMFLARKKARS